MEAHAEHIHHHHHHDDVEVNPAEWTDGKRYAWLLGIVVPLSPFFAYLYWELSGFGGMWFIGPFLVFVIFPLLDMAIGRDSVNPPDSVLKFLEQDRYYRWCTYLFIPIQYAGLVFACWIWASGEINLIESIGLAMTMGVVGGIAINTAHELGHKRASSEKWLSRIALAQTGYGHFFIEHNRGHHVKVATPADPASSRLGESFWAFLPRTVVGSVRSAWEIEAARLDRLGKSHWGRHNDILGAWAMTVVLFAGLGIVFGAVVLPYLLVQAVIGFSLLEVVNYLEHYGLLRQKRGRPLRALPAGTQLEQQQRRFQRPPLPPAAPLRPPRQPDPPLPGAAPCRRGAAAADRVCGDDRPRLVPAALAPGDGPPPARALRRRRHQVQHPAAQARAGAGALRAGRVSAWRCPSCGYVFDEEAGHPREGFPAGTSWADVPDDWACPDCGVRDKIDFEPVAGDA